MVNITKKSVLQFLKYNVGGLAYFWSAWLIITFGNAKLGVTKAYIIGNVVGLSLNFVVQKYWAFSTKKEKFLSSGWKFIVFTAVSQVLGYVLFKYLVHLLIPIWLAQFINAGFFTIWNWVGYKIWVFKESK